MRVIRGRVRLALAAALFFPAAAFAQQSAAGRNAGEIALRAFQKGYPDKVSDVSFRNGDWTITVGGRVFYWADGRLLPEAERGNAGAYSAHGLYRIPEKPPSPDDYSPQYIEAMRSRGSRDVQRQRRDTHPDFRRALHGGSTRAEVEALLERIEFFGGRVTVHRDIAGALRRVDAEVRRLPGGTAFIATLGSVTGFSWRQIAGTQRMSYHSWGIAVDIQPRSLNGKATYWLWESERNGDWMLVPLENRWHPPEFVIRAFEREGFIWGGNWPVYDTMHFEYRPELHEYTRLMSADPPPTSGAGIGLHHVLPVFPRR